MTQLRTDYSDIHFKNDGKLKLLIIVGTRPEIIRLGAVINKCRRYFDTILAHTGQNYDYNLNGFGAHPVNSLGSARELSSSAVSPKTGSERIRSKRSFLSPESFIIFVVATE